MCFVLNSLPRTGSHCRAQPESSSRCHARVVRTLQRQIWHRVAIGQRPGSAEGEQDPVGCAPHSVILSLVRGLHLASGDHFLHLEGSHHNYSHSPQTSQSLHRHEPPRRPHTDVGTTTPSGLGGVCGFSNPTKWSRELSLGAKLSKAVPGFNKEQHRKDFTFLQMYFRNGYVRKQLCVEDGCEHEHFL